MNFLGFTNHKIKRLKTDEDFDTYASAFAKDMGYTVPGSFLKTGKAWGIWRKDDKDQSKGEWVAGYGLIKDWPVRSIEEIPKDKLIPVDPKLVGEFTAIWVSNKYLDTKYFGFFFSFQIMWNLLIHPSKYYVYSYPISEVKLGNYYAKGHPIRIYSGPIVRLEGHPENPEDENVELLTTFGVFKIVIHRNLKYFKVLFQSFYEKLKASIKTLFSKKEKKKDQNEVEKEKQEEGKTT